MQHCAAISATAELCAFKLWKPGRSYHDRCSLLVAADNSVLRSLAKQSHNLLHQCLPKWVVYSSVCLHNQAPQYLTDLCQSVSNVASRQYFCSASRGLLVVPRHRLSSYGQRAFSVASPAIWNWLPDSLRDPAISRDSFKRSLNTFLFSAYSCT